MQIDWSQIETVLLDMDGTLLDLHFDNFFWRSHLPSLYSQQYGVATEQAQAKLETMFIEYAGTLEWYCVDFWSNELNIDVMQHKRDVAEKIAYRPRAQAFLDQCRRESDDVRLITNAHRKVLNLKIEFTGIDQYFEQMICSHELEHPKEQQAFWHRLQQRQNFDPERAIFIDDSETVLDSAAEYGIRYLYSISQPDSENDREMPSKYPMIETFDA